MVLPPAYIQRLKKLLLIGGMLDSMHDVGNLNVENRKTSFADFTEILKKTRGVTHENGGKAAIKEFLKYDFRPIFEYYDLRNNLYKILFRFKR